VALLETMVEQLGQALDSARLYEEAQRREARERLIGQVTARMRESLDVDTILKASVREMREALGIAEVQIHLGTLEA
jgi:GAF domain-containing protein